MSDQPQILILCIGNSLLLDEGFGPWIANELLLRYVFPAEVTILDRGVMGMAILADLRQADEVLIIDALDNTGQAPGTIMEFRPEDLAAQQIFHGAHDISMIDVIRAASLVGINPSFTCYGVQVKEISLAEYQIGLTPEVLAAVPLMIDIIIAWLDQRGVAVQPVE
ncbi:MAG: hydrogenase maturation protease [Coriobacteriales bacterium]|jgi:hydrogenase maturation protease|nr:hydrogenase maturation protease [Coriobacteriales bacterium]